ncbi:MAG: hypothetical protein CBC35_03760 [Planctomycetes bacterium TMED75]|nr:hypothetical protein [Planctomycetaceae bacterium]OUU94606.1 MAG: hypothetical protein CBC35_03760 [Planctomycetes bacterium TMED75]
MLFRLFQRDSPLSVLALSSLMSLMLGSASVCSADDDLAFYTSILSNSDIQIEVRSNAVSRMLRLGGELPERTISEMLRSGDDQVIQAIAQALVGAGPPSPLLTDSLITVLAVTTPDNGALIGTTLSRHGDPVLESVLELHEKQRAADGSRIALIRSVAAFQSRLAVDSLVTFLKEPSSSEELAAALRGLREITRLELGNDVSSWVGWWNAVGDMPLEQAIGAVSRDREQRLLEQEQQIALLNQKNQSIGERLQQVLADWFITLPEDQKEPALRQLLAEELVYVRMFAGLQVQRMLRNGVTPESDTIDQIMRLLDDDESALRILAAQLGSAMRVDGLADRLAASITAEDDPQVASMLIEQIVLDPSPAAFTPVLFRLNDPVTAQSSARALARLVDVGMVPDDWAVRSLESIRGLHSSHPMPSSAALLVLAGEPEDLDRAVNDLEHESLAVRRASANAFVVRGRFDEVLARSDDPAIRPAAIRALDLVEPTTQSLDHLLSLTPSDAEVNQWKKVVENHAARFPIDQRIDVDDLLSKDDRVPRQLRLQVLAAALSSFGEGAPSELQWAILDRQTELLVEEVRWQEISDTLFGLDCSGHDSLRLRLFIARIRLGDFEGAAQVESNPQLWINLLDGTFKVAPAEAAVIAIEIEQRFGEQLNEAQREQLEFISQSLAVASVLEVGPDS